ncbi:2OG-Fe dioxygenase family protein [Alteribacillus iranensis]|uniref:2OG-Fe dioxygenase n=1 Tax=Alteribacillus iranensis TaxID=930128 RepID=A0A1I2DHM8_9BACI|nr:2OG-Fe dioxygenase family protein [Alteribacillus iranensis]SFE80026.1 2OG-Fe dioxygenase [Alteribacillus iranensis]
MSQLRKTGFAYYHLGELIQYEGVEKDLEQLQNAFDDLPPDEYAPHLNRRRRYARAVIMPGSHRVEWLPETIIDGQDYYEYFQGSFNPEYTGEYRRFPALTKETRANRLLEEIIRFDFKETFWMKEDALMPIHAGIHFVKLYVKEEGDVAVSSPNNLHQDGEPFTFAHLIRRRNINGGINAIASPKHRGKMLEDMAENEVMTTFYLEEALESYGVYDPLVAHYVGEVTKGNEEGSGERSAILIDFQPTVIANPDDIRSMLGDTTNMISV